MSSRAVALAKRVEQEDRKQPQVPTGTQHLFHNGVYYRSMTLAPGTRMTGSLMKTATGLIVNGNVLVYNGSRKPLHLVGHHVIAAEAGRKSIFMAQSETSMTLVYATKATTVDAVERELTDEYLGLQNRQERA